MTTDFYLPTALYEAIPFVYMIFGVLAIFAPSFIPVWIHGVLLLIVSVAVIKMRVIHRYIDN